VHIWDNNDIVLELTERHQLKCRYIRASGLILQSIGENRFYYIYNAHGDTVRQIDQNKDLTPEYIYDAFGNQYGLKDSTYVMLLADSNPFRYCGEYFDTDTEELYLRNRNYDSRTGRFTQEDPINSGDNWYCYCDNNPVNCSDPSGCLTQLQIANDPNMKAKIAAMKATNPTVNWVAPAPSVIPQAASSTPSIASSSGSVGTAITVTALSPTTAGVGAITKRLAEISASLIALLAFLGDLLLVGLCVLSVAAQIYSILQLLQRINAELSKAKEAAKEEQTTSKDIAGSTPSNPNPGDDSEKPKSPRKIKNNKEANNIAKNFGYKDAHALKKDFGVGSDFNMFVDTTDGSLWLQQTSTNVWINTGLIG